jgi:carbon monoxide dehydrogenase subunit G
MARYTTSVRSSLPADEAFAFMADFRNAADWDPGVTGVRQVDGDGGGLGAAYEVTVRAPGGDRTMRYVTTAYEPPGWVVLVADGSTLRSEDRISVAPAGDGCVVTYDAELRLRGPLGLLHLLDPALALAFRRVGDRAAAGLRRALGGTAA